MKPNKVKGYIPDELLVYLRRGMELEIEGLMAKVHDLESELKSLSLANAESWGGKLTKKQHALANGWKQKAKKKAKLKAKPIVHRAPRIKDADDRIRAAVAYFASNRDVVTAADLVARTKLRPAFIFQRLRDRAQDYGLRLGGREKGKRYYDIVTPETTEDRLTMDEPVDQLNEGESDGAA